MMSQGRSRPARVRVTAASLLNALGIISGALHAELKELAAGLNAFSDAPATHPVSPALGRMYQAASFCGFWGVANYLGGLKELAVGIENNPPLSVDRTEYLERVKTLAAGVNALGVHLREISTGGVPSYTALNEQFGKVIRKARPVLLELEPEIAGPLMFMPAPPSLEADATWLPLEGASHVSLCEALLAFLGSDEVSTLDLRNVAAANPYRTLSGLFETAACDAEACAVEPLATDLRREYGRILSNLDQGLPAVPPTPDAFLFSRLMHGLAAGADESLETLALRRRYALVRPRGNGQVVSMHDVARKFSAGMTKLRDGYMQAAMSQTPFAVKKLALAVHTDAGKLQSEAFSAFASALHDFTSEWTPNSNLSFGEWTHGAALVLMLLESAENWSASDVQDDLLALARSMGATKLISPCTSLQSATRMVALQKACTAILVETTELKMGIEGSLRSFGEDELNDAQCARLVEVIAAKATKLLDTVHGFCICVGMPRAAAFAAHLRATLLRAGVWQTQVDRAEVFDGLSRLSLFIGRLRPSSLIDIEDDEMGIEGEAVVFAAPDAATEPEVVIVDLTREVAAEPVTSEQLDAIEGAPAASGDIAEATESPEPEVHAADEGHDRTEADLNLLAPDSLAASVAAEVPQPTVAVEGAVLENERSDADVIGMAPVVEAAAVLEAAPVVDAAEAEALFGFDDMDDFGMPPKPALAAPMDVDPQALLELFLAAGNGLEDRLDTEDTELMNIMFEECDQCMGDIGEIITMWIADDDAERLTGTVAEARRHIHTLKGVARTCGLMKVGGILHSVEDNLELMPDDGVSLRASLSAYMGAMTVVRDALDNARSVFEASLASGSAMLAQSTEVAAVTPGGLKMPVDASTVEAVEMAMDEAVASVAHAVTTPAPFDAGEAVVAESPLTPLEAVAPAAETPEVVAAVVAEVTVESEPTGVPVAESAIELVEAAESADSGVEEVADELAVAPAATVTAAAPAARADGSVRVPLKLANKVGAASGQVLMASRRSLEVVDGSLRTLRELDVNIKRMGPVLRELDIMATASIASAAGGAASNGFDALELDRYTALQELVRRLKEAYEDSVGSATSLTEGLRSMRGAEEERAQLSDDLQRESSELMLVSVSTQRARLERVVAKACEDTGKRASLVVDSRCRVPAAALDKLMPVFEHLLRNAVAHGIESPAVRAAAGKPASGVIAIAMPRAGNMDGSVVKVAVSDDGAGIDHAVVLAIAQKRGLALRDRQYNDAAVRDFLFMPGFSTAATVSQLAGRGVGLDVVRSAVAALGGLVSVDSKTAQGTEFTLVLPTDITSMSVVPVTARGYTCLLPLTLVSRIVPVSSSLEVVLNEAAGTVSIAGVVHELVDLASRVPTTGDVRGERGGRGHLVLMRESDVTKAVLVDSIGNQSRMVVRQLGPFVRDVPGMVAGTLLANGEVGLVVNPLRLHELAAAPAEQGAAAPRTKHIMVVDDSSTVRMVTTRFLKRLGFEVSTAKDGLDALQTLSRGVRPDGFLFDLEMPGMDGFDLISEIRRKPEHTHAPIVVISSRTAEKHRERARELGATAYLTKPYEDSQLQEVLESLVGLPA
jgi:chemotaxis protein histidine kinase CheA